MAYTFAVNVAGALAVSTACLDQLRRSSRPRILTVSSQMSYMGYAKSDRIAYRASKAALNQIVHGAAIELGRSHPDAICVALHPGTVETPFTAQYTGRDKLAPSDAANRLLTVLDGLVPADSGQFFDHNSAAVPW